MITSGRGASHANGRSCGNGAYIQLLTTYDVDGNVLAEIDGPLPGLNLIDLDQLQAASTLHIKGLKIDHFIRYDDGCITRVP